MGYKFTYYWPNFNQEVLERPETNLFFIFIESGLSLGAGRGWQTAATAAKPAWASTFDLPLAIEGPLRNSLAGMGPTRAVCCANEEQSEVERRATVWPVPPEIRYR